MIADTANSRNALAQARSFLFVPGNRPERFDKAVNSGADAVVLDLEDAVPVADKASARQAIAQAWPQLSQASVPVIVRINAAQSAMGQDDLQALSGLSGLPAIMLPKAESAQTLAQVHSAWPQVAFLPLIESAAGYAALNEIAAGTAVIRLVLGDIDFMADTGLQASADATELTPLRFAMAMATRTQQLAPAVDGVTADFRNDESLRRDAERSLRYGFGAKLCIHPRQIPILHDALAPTAEQVGWAQRVLAADANAGGSAVQLDGQMIDRPVVLQAQRVLARLPSQQF